MTRRSATVLLADMGCAGGTAHTAEVALLRVPGVSRAYINPVTEAAYVEYDAESCTEADLVTAVESVGFRAVHAAAATSALSTKPARPSMSDSTHHSRTWWAFAGFLAIAGFFLITEHRAHLFGVLPFLLLLACPLLHMFGHGGHGGHGGHADDEHKTGDLPHGHSARAGDDARPSANQQSSGGATRDDWRN